MGYALGVMAPPNLPIRTFVDYVTNAERCGFDKVWFAEDCFLKGGIGQAAVALASTKSIVIGMGILPAGARNVAFAALEIAFLPTCTPSGFCRHRTWDGGLDASGRARIRLQQLHNAGADHLALTPTGSDAVEALDSLSRRKTDRCCGVSQQPRIVSCHV